MMPHKQKDTVVVLDLDDTLYAEVDYQESGIEEVCRWVNSVYGVSIERKDVIQSDATQNDWLAEICRLAGLQQSVKESLLWVYRLHEPKICLSEKNKIFIKRLEDSGRVAILTDGRSITQRLKLKKLGLGKMPAYISEEHASCKPSPVRFELIMKDMPAERYIYVGDNPQKDFVAPNNLGWLSIGLRSKGSNIHPQETAGFVQNAQPQFWVDALDDVLRFL